jgi:Mrp family chromosome partitioning ATPase
MAKYFSGVCLVVRNGKTSRSAAERAVWLLEQSRANIVGTILNRLPRGNGAAYYYYYYGDEYAKGAANGAAGGAEIGTRRNGAG